jgi:O6-methylguanine-DNA--protein-cysteine methyltransferase
LAKIDLLQDVVQFKMRFYRCPWAMYEKAKPRSLKLLPPEHHVAELKKDYQAMQAMPFGQIPSFEEIMTELGSLEKTINALGK